MKLKKEKKEKRIGIRLDKTTTKRLNYLTNYLEAKTPSSLIRTLINGFYDNAFTERIKIIFVYDRNENKIFQIHEKRDIISGEIKKDKYSLMNFNKLARLTGHPIKWSTVRMRKHLMDLKKTVEKEPNVECEIKII